MTDMDLNELIGINQETANAMDHDELYDRLVNALGGPEAFLPYMPADLDSIKEAYARDRNLNSIPLRRWDEAAGFRTAGHKCEPTGTGLWKLLHAHRVTWASASEGVCLLKHAAIRLIEDDRPVRDAKI